MKPMQQGDVFFKPVAKVPEGAVRVLPENGRFILVKGEQTGHAHTIQEEGVAVWALTRNGITQLYVDVASPATVTHEEHDPLILETGVALVDRKRELDFYGDFERRVVD